MKKKGIKYTLFGVLAILLVLLIGGFTWLNQTYKPTDQLFELVSDDEYKKVDDFYVFEPKKRSKWSRDCFISRCFS